MATREEAWDDQPPGHTSVRKSLLLSFSNTYLRICIQVAATAIIARLLSPEEYGIFTIGMVIVTVTQVLTDFGVMSFLIQEKNLTDSLVRTAYGISLLIGCFLGGAMALSSHAIAEFYHSDGVQPVLLVLSLNFVLGPFGSIVMTLLKREMNFTAFAWINVGASVANNGVGVMLAYLGFGAISLAWASLANIAAICLGAATMRPKQFTMIPSLKEWRRISAFGLVASAGILTNSIGGQAPSLVMGRLLGVETLGIFGRAAGLVGIFSRLVTGPIIPVAVSAIALHHRSGADMKEGFLRAVALMTGIAWPFFAFVALMAFPVVRIMFGGGWDAAIPIARILCFSESVLAFSSLNFLLFQGRGEVSRNLKVQLIVQPISVILIVIAAQFDLFTVAMTIAVISVFSVVTSYRFVNSLIGTRYREVLGASAKSLGLAASTAFVPTIVLMTMTIDENHTWLPLIVSAVGGGIGWLVAARVLKHPLHVEIAAALAPFQRWVDARLRVKFT